VTPVNTIRLMGDQDEAHLDRLHGDLIAEYYKLADLVTSFDQRLLTIKGWGVTLSLASLGLGFQQDHYGLFLVAALSGLSFWIVEATTKFHQLRYYPRMGDIEASTYELFRVDGADGPMSSPLIDWSWYTAKRRLRGGPTKGELRVPQRWPEENPLAFWPRVRFSTMLYPHVMFSARDRARRWSRAIRHRPLRRVRVDLENARVERYVRSRLWPRT
jgi:hypothetical protein